jgi:hypothetical protein
MLHGDIIVRTGADYEAMVASLGITESSSGLARLKAAKPERSPAGPGLSKKRRINTARAIISPAPIKLRTGDNAVHLAVGAGLFAEKGLSLLKLFRDTQFSEKQSVDDSVVRRMPEFEEYLPDEVKHGAFDKPLVREIE